MKISEAKQKFFEYLSIRPYADSTIRNYVSIAEAFCRYLSRDPKVVGLPHSKRVEKYLTHRVVNDDVSRSTQDVELNALISFHSMLGVRVESVNAIRAEHRDIIPPILSQEQIKTLIEHFPQDVRIVPKLLYGNAMRINEVLRLRIKDVDLSLRKIIIHEAKGGKERIVTIPNVLFPIVEAQRNSAIKKWREDKERKFNGVHCGGIEKKYPAYPKSKDWYWFLPARDYSTDPKTGTTMMRHHIQDYEIQRIFSELRVRLELPSYTTPHTLRHACLTHMAEDMMRQGFPEKMIKAHLKELAGHVMDKTLDGYLHLAAPQNAVVRSPIETL